MRHLNLLGRIGAASVVAVGLVVAAAYWFALTQLRSARTARRADAYGAAERHLAACWPLPGLHADRELEHDLAGLQQGDLSDEESWQARSKQSSDDGSLILEALAKGNLSVFRWNEARAYADAILERQSNHAQALWLRGQAWVKVQQEPKALEDFTQALEYEPDAFKIRRSLADLLHKLGRGREADEHYVRLRQERPADARVVLALAHCRQEEALLNDAQQLVDELLAAKPASIEALIEKSRLLLRMGRPEQAEQRLRVALEHKPDHAEACFVLQLCLGAQQKSDEALTRRVEENEQQQAALRLKIQDAPRDPALLAEQGRWLLRAFDWREAVGWFYLALAAGPNHASAHAGLAEYFALTHQPLRSQHHARLAGATTAPPTSLAHPTGSSPSPLASESLSTLPPVSEASEADVHRLCAACHAYPPPESFPKAAWRKEVKQGYDLLRDSALSGEVPSLESVVAYYERRAADQLPSLDALKLASSSPFRFEPKRTGWLANVPPFPAIANLQLASLLGSEKLELLASDARLNRILLLKPYGTAAEGEILPQVLVPCHTAVADLDNDGQRDILVASLGQFYPTDAKVGSVTWLRRQSDGKFATHTLISSVGRVSDVQAADFSGDGKLDLIVAAFGWRRTGEILYLENQTTDWSQPKFEQFVVDVRHGAIHVPVADLNADGRPDFVALLSQEHEAVVAYLNEGSGAFRPKTIFTGPHPAYGSSGIEIVDLDGDEDLDVLLTNGDVLDRPYLLKPYHRIQWLENDGTYPFTHHPLTSMYGASRAVAADFDGDRDLDIAAVSFLPRLEFPEREALRLPSLMLLEQTSRGRFTTHVLETGACDHFTCAAGDWDADGDADLAVGNFSWKRSQAMSDGAVLWFNQGRR